MAIQAIIGAIVFAVAIAVALLLERKKRSSAEPVRDVYPIPRQLTRSDFPGTDYPWLVVLFSSRTCDSCEVMRQKVEVLASDQVQVYDAEYSVDRVLHERYAISGVPLVVVADHQGVVSRAFVGPVSATDLWAAVASSRDANSSAGSELGRID